MVTLVLVIPFSDVCEIFVVVDVVVFLVGLVAERLGPDRRKSDVVLKSKQFKKQALTFSAMREEWLSKLK